MIGRASAKAAILLAMLLGSLPAAAQNLLATVGGAGGGSSTLVELDPATGALIRTIGPVGYRVNGLTWDNTTRSLYATTSNTDPAFANGLLRISLFTGAGTRIGAGAGQLVNVVTANSSGGVFGWTENSDQPVRWNTTAGTVTVLGGGVGSARESLAFDNADVLYFLNCGGCSSPGNGLYTINTTTGAATFLGDVAGVASGTAHHGDFNPANNLLYAIDQNGNGNNPRNLYTINVATRTVTSTLPTVNDLHTVAFLPAGALAAATTIPVNDPVALAFLAVFLVLGGGYYLRRRQA